MDSLNSTERLIHYPSYVEAAYSWLQSKAWLLLICAIAIIAINTRLQSAKQQERQSGSTAAVPAVPYWLPLIGHIPSMVWDATAFLRRLRSTYTGGAYALNLGGTVHNIIYAPGHVTALLNTKESSASNESVADTIGERVFGFPMKTEAEKYNNARAEISACYSHLLNEADLSEMVRGTAETTKHSIANLVSFSPSIVDQAYWERTAGVELTTDSDGTQVVAANLVDLVRDFCAVASNASVIGPDFIRNYPDFLADLWIVDRAFLYLGAGLPRWTPIPLVTRAHIARRNIIQRMSIFEQAMDKQASGQDPGPEWRDLDEVGAVIKARTKVYRKHGMSLAARAAFDFGLLWATNANSNMLVFWMLNHIYADPSLLATIREEIAPYARAVQPKQEFAVAEAPRLEHFDIDGLCANCPLLKSCYVECLRYDAATWSFKVAMDDFTLSPREKEAQAFVLRKGDFIHAAHDLHNTDPKYFPNPDAWQADRHVKVGADGKRTADLGTIRPYGEQFDPSLCGANTA